MRSPFRCNCRIPCGQRSRLKPYRRLVRGLGCYHCGVCCYVVSVTARSSISQCCIVLAFRRGRSRRACCGSRNRCGMPFAGRGDGVTGAANNRFVYLCRHLVEAPY
jgi:hypothetical protein